MTILVLAEHNNKSLAAATRNAVTAAAAIGGDTHVLVAGQGCGDVAKQVAAIKGVAKVLVCDNAAYSWPLAENIAPLIASTWSRSHSARTATDLPSVRR